MPNYLDKLLDMNRGRIQLTQKKGLLVRIKNFRELEVIQCSHMTNSVEIIELCLLFDQDTKKYNQLKRWK